MKCSVCKKSLIEKDMKMNGKAGVLDFVGGAGLYLLGGPIIATIGTISLGHSAYTHLFKKEFEIKCPHCGAKITLSKDEYKELERYIQELKDAEKKSKQNRVER